MMATCDLSSKYQLYLRVYQSLTYLKPILVESINCPPTHFVPSLYDSITFTIWKKTLVWPFPKLYG